MEVADLIVLWRVFEQCNLGCDFCGYSTQIDRPRAVADVERVIALGETLSAYSQSRGRRVLVSWLGGEPLLWPELPRLSRLFHRELGVRVGVTSNGLPLGSTGVRASLVTDYAQLTVSVDGVGAFHDACRNSPGLYDRLRRNVIALRAEADAAGSPLLIKVNTILMRGNVAEFETLCREVAEWGVRELTFNQLGGNDRPEYYPANRLLPEQVDRFVSELPGVRERVSRLGLVIHGSERYLHRLASTARGQRIPIDDCAPGAWFLFIDEHGRVAPCSFTADTYGVAMKEIVTWEDLEALPKEFAGRRCHRVAACDDCHSTQVFDKFASGGGSAPPNPLSDSDRNQRAR